MHDHHHHEHASGTRDRGRRALVWALALNGGFLVIEGGIGLMTNSLALLSDAAHMLSDVATLVMALVATKLAQREPLPHQTFGLLRAEVMGAFLNGIALLAACTWILVEALERVAEPPQVPGLPMFVVGAIGLAINLGSAWGLWRSDHHNLNIRGALVHMLADALGSIGAMLAAILVMRGMWLADPVISVIIAVLVLFGAWGVLRDSGRVLLQLPPPTANVPAMRTALNDLDGVCGLHDLHVWTLDGNAPIVTAHLIADQPNVQAAARTLLREKFQVRHATLQVESEHCGAAPFTPIDADEHGHRQG